jgi:hypothetical protein
MGKIGSNEFLGGKRFAVPWANFSGIAAVEGMAYLHHFVFTFNDLKDKGEDEECLPVLCPHACGLQYPFEAFFLAIWPSSRMYSKTFQTLRPSGTIATKPTEQYDLASDLS